MNIKLELPDEIYIKLKERSEKKGFKSIENYIVYVITQIVKTIDESESNEEISKEDEEKIKNELKKMGYID